MGDCQRENVRQVRCDSPLVRSTMRRSYRTILSGAPGEVLLRLYELVSQWFSIRLAKKIHAILEPSKPRQGGLLGETMRFVRWKANMTWRFHTTSRIAIAIVVHCSYRLSISR